MSKLFEGLMPVGTDKTDLSLYVHSSVFACVVGLH